MRLEICITGSILLGSAQVLVAIDLHYDATPVHSVQQEVDLDVAYSFVDFEVPSSHDHPSKELELGWTRTAQQLNILAVEGEFPQDPLLLHADIEVCDYKQSLTGSRNGYINEVVRTLDPSVRTRGHALATTGLKMMTSLISWNP